jgi:hypothetical protein
MFEASRPSERGAAGANARVRRPQRTDRSRPHRTPENNEGTELEHDSYQPLAEARGARVPGRARADFRLLRRAAKAPPNPGRRNRHDRRDRNDGRPGWLCCRADDVCDGLHGCGIRCLQLRCLRRSVCGPAGLLAGQLPGELRRRPDPVRAGLRRYQHQRCALRRVQLGVPGRSELCRRRLRLRGGTERLRGRLCRYTERPCQLRQLRQLVQRAGVYGWAVRQRNHGRIGRHHGDHHRERRSNDNRVWRLRCGERHRGRHQRCSQHHRW